MKLDFFISQCIKVITLLLAVFVINNVIMCQNYNSSHQ